MYKKILFLTGILITGYSEMGAQTKAAKYCKAPVTMTAVKPVLNSQNEINYTETPENEHPYGGTFQFISNKMNKKEMFTTEILKLIEEKRLLDQEQILVLSPDTKVRILSKKQISDPNFQPIKYLYLFE